MKRPIGISILSVFDIIIGFLLLLSGLVMISIGSFLKYLQPNNFPKLFPSGEVLYLIRVFGGILGILLLIFGIIGVMTGYFLWNGRDFARIFHIVLSLLLVLNDLPTLYSSLRTGLLIIMINGFIVYYLTRPNVKIFFKASKQ